MSSPRSWQLLLALALVAGAMILSHGGSAVNAASASSAGDVLFRDDFDGLAVDPGNWVAFANNGTVTVSGGTLQLEAGVGGTAPYLYSAYDPFPAGDFIVRIRARYISSDTKGVGFQLARHTPGNGVSPCPAQPTQEYGLPIAALWGGRGMDPPNNGVAVATLDNPLGQWMVPEGNGNALVVEPRQDYHLYEFAFVGGLVQIKVDGILVTTSTTPATTPTVMWLGNPVVCNPGDDWSDLEVDFVEVQAAKPPPPVGGIAARGEPERLAAIEAGAEGASTTSRVLSVAAVVAVLAVASAYFLLARRQRPA